MGPHSSSPNKLWKISLAIAYAFGQFSCTLENFSPLRQYFKIFGRLVNYFLYVLHQLLLQYIIKHRILQYNYKITTNNTDTITRFDVPKTNTPEILKKLPYT